MRLKKNRFFSQNMGTLKIMSSIQVPLRQKRMTHGFWHSWWSADFKMVRYMGISRIFFQNRRTVYCQNPHFFRFLGLFFVVKYQSPLKIPLFEHQNLKIQYSDKIHLQGQIISFSESIHMLGFFRVPANLLDHYGNIPKL